MQCLVVLMIIFIRSTFTLMAAQQQTGTLIVKVQSNSEPVEQAEVNVGERVVVTNATGEASFELSAGPVEIHIQRYGFKPKTSAGTVQEGTVSRIEIDLEPEVVLNQEITVTATRSGVRIEDEPLRVEVLGQEEVEEKTMMTPGDIAMMLNETSGLRVQVTSPSLGAANVRVQGLRGRYTQLLSDGLPLYGGQTGSIGLLQIPPLDLAQVEVIKGVASALYGSSALGGVINLVSRRPTKSEREVLVNATTRGGQDTAFWLAEPAKNHIGYTVLGGAHFQELRDINRDGWADMPAYRRMDMRPRLFWDDGKGRSLFATVGAMAEEREGGTVANATVANGQRFPEELGTRRFDTGVTARLIAGDHPVAIRGSAMTQRHRHQFGDVMERDRTNTFFGEATISGSASRHTGVLGFAMQADFFRSQTVPAQNYRYIVPAIFVQDEYAVNSTVTLSGSARLDIHNKYGAFFNPRLSALIRLPRKVTARVSTGTGVFAPTPFTEETEAVGLSRLLPLTDVKPERARSASGDLGWSTAHLEINGTLFASIVHDPVQLRTSGTTIGALQIVNVNGPTRTVGSEFMARLRASDFGLVLTHTLIHSTEIDRDTLDRQLVPLTPKHTAGIVGTWEKEEWGRVGIEMFYTGRQRLEDNPYRNESRAYTVFGVLIERRVGSLRLFINGENLTNVRQTIFDPLLRRTPSFDGQWTVDQWAPLDGRVINGGFRFRF
jgi:outer membrane receptor for ferrienterochelin and colicins